MTPKTQHLKMRILRFLLYRRILIDEQEMEDILEELDKFYRKTTNFGKAVMA